MSGPLTYSAVSDRVIRAKPTLPSIGGTGGAGTKFNDPAYGTRMLRVTDRLTRPDRPDRFWATPSGSETCCWNTDGTKFYIVGGGGEQLPYTFDKRTMTASRMGDLNNGSGGLVLLLAGEPCFGGVDADLLYGQGSADSATFVQYRFSTATETTLHDIHSVLPGISTHGTGMSVTKDEQRFAIGTGGASQDNDIYIYVFDRALGGRWLNISTGQVGGAWGPTGAYTGDSGLLIHNVRISKNGQWARVTTVGGAGMYFWEIATLTLTA
jgi:hypothetical protein